MSPTSTQALLLSNEHFWLCITYTGSVNFDCQYLRVQNRPFRGSWVFPGSCRTWDVLINSTSCSHCTSSLRTVTAASVSSLKRVVRLFTPICANSSSYNRSHGGSVCLPFAETDRLKMSLFVAVIKNSVSPWARLHVVALASTPKTGTVLQGGLSHESFVSVTRRLVVCGLLFVARASMPH